MKQFLSRMLLCIFLILFIGSVSYLIWYYVKNQSSAQLYDELKVEAYKQTADSEDASANASNENTIANAIDFASLSKKNQDISAWLSILDTSVDYPVMDSTSSHTDYLHMNFEKDKDSHGALFFETDCVPGKSDSNLLIYGHNMKDGTMFANLMQYEDQDYARKHKKVILYTPEKAYEYEVFATFTTDLSSDNKDAFLYSDYTDLSSEKTFQEFMSEVDRTAIYNSAKELNVSYKDSLLMLSTCEYSSDNGRLVVLCKRMQ